MKAALRTKRRPKAPSVTGSSSVSEWNVIVHLGDIGCRLFGTTRRSAAFTCAAFARSAARRRFIAAFVTAASAAIARAEQLHVLGDDLGRVLVVAFLVRPFARLEPALDVNGPPL